jgi:hypothetical protein
MSEMTGTGAKRTSTDQLTSCFWSAIEELNKPATFAPIFNCFLAGVASRLKELAEYRSQSAAAIPCSVAA